ncbi:putative amino acid permease YhdG [Actinoalloteichus hoggarensis]|uniref:Putative amino acid permease YhdG n=2 Tax=Actinoalloteichus hoggarensis TaxID=1470176 RepID=A0A221WAD7_9PSEU|nr:putative amino acid permease YhdG [Actinoalloteichus hoggarensis]
MVMVNGTSGESPVRPASDEPTLKRVMGPRLLLLFVIGNILGTGIYAVSGRVAGVVGGALWVPFLIAFGIAFLTAFSYVELVGKYPRAAGAALYTNRAFRSPFFTFMIAFAVMCSGITSASSAARAVSGDYLQEFVTVPALLVAIVFIALLALVNLRGVTESLIANVVLTVIELLGLLIVIAIGVGAVLNGAGDPSRLLEFNAEHGTLLAVTSATALAFFALVGFEDSVNMAEECHEPSKIFPRGLLLGLSITGLIYVLVALTSSLLVETDVLAGSDGPLLEVVRIGAPGFPLILFSAIAICAVSNSALMNMMMASRLLYGMARERIIPRQFGRVLPVRRTPWVAIVFTSMVAVVLVSTVDIALLGGTTSLLLLVVFGVVNIAVLVLRREEVDHRHFRAPTAMPVLGAVTCFLLASPLTGRPAEEYGIAGILLAIGLVFWALNRMIVGRAPIDPAAGSRPVD